MKTETTRIVIVDDHELLRDGMRVLLEGVPDLMVCGEASTEDEAMMQLQSTSPDLMIIDVMLEQGNGIDLVKRIKAKAPSVRTLVVSMYEERLYAERALRAGASGYFNKRQPARMLLDAIDCVLADHVYLSPKMTKQLLRRSAKSGDCLEYSPVEDLSDRELEVFQLIGQAYTTGEIAQHMHLSPRTVETYRQRLKTKLNLDTAAELSQRAVQWVLEHA